MNQRAIVMTIVLFTLLILGMFVFAYLKDRELDAATTMPGLGASGDALL